MDAPLNGKRVTLSGLKARPDLNGLTADVLSFNEASGRYTVSMVNSQEQLALKAANLSVVVTRSHDGGARFQIGVRITVKGLTSKPELNGHSGTITEWNEEKGRYGVQMDNVANPLSGHSAPALLLRGDNLQLVKAEWKPEWRTPEGQAAIDQGFAEHVAQEWEKAKKGPFG